MKPTPSLVVRALRAEFLHHGGRMTWEQIHLAMGVHFEVRNWLAQIRGPLQWMLDHGEIRRDSSDIRVEAYEAVTGGNQNEQR